MCVTAWLSPIVSRVEDDVGLTTAVGGVLLLGVVRSACVCRVVLLLSVYFVSRDLAVIRRARNLL